jgi:hypothetical protein
MNPRRRRCNGVKGSQLSIGSELSALFGEIIAVRSGRTGDSVKQRSALPEHSRADFVSTGFDGTVGEAPAMKRSHYGHFPARFN